MTVKLIEQEKHKANIQKVVGKAEEDFAIIEERAKTLVDELKKVE